MLAESGHMIMMEQPMIVNDAILKFLLSDLPQQHGNHDELLSPTHSLRMSTESQHRTKSQPSLKHSSTQELHSKIHVHDVTR